jgi:hypothetical protein
MQGLIKNLQNQIYHQNMTIHNQINCLSEKKKKWYVLQMNQLIIA